MHEHLNQTVPELNSASRCGLGTQEGDNPPIQMVGSSSDGTNCEQNLTTEWQTLEKIANSPIEEQSFSDVAGELLGTLKDGNEFLERYAPHFSEDNPEDRGPSL